MSNTNTITQQLKADFTNYRTISAEYKRLVELSEISRETAVKLREERHQALIDKRLAAEDVLMSMMNFKKEALVEAGIFDFYHECTKGSSNISDNAVFKIVDVTMNCYLPTL